MIRLVLLAVCSFALPSLAGERENWITAINDYNATLGSVEASFVQNSEGETLDGKIYINRPAKRLKVEYGQRGRVIVANGGTLTHYDPKVQSFATYPLESTAAAVFLQRRLDALPPPEGGFYIGDIHEKDNELLVEVTSSERKEDRVELAFGKSPLKLLGWRLADGLGSSVTVRLGEISGRSFASDFFDLRDPRPKPF